MLFSAFKRARKVWISAFVFAGYGLISASGEGENENAKYQLGGYAFWQLGQIVDGFNNEGTKPSDATPISHQMTSSALLGLAIEARPNPHLKIMLSPEFKLYYPYPERINMPVTVRPNNVGFINEGYGTVSIGDVEKPFVNLTIGMFLYKYNPHSTNLGEYMFRTGTYPTYVITDFDFPKARLLGMRATCDFVKNLHMDLLFTSEYQYYPLYDFSFSSIVHYTFLKAINVGAGFDMARVIPAVEEKTSPKISSFFEPTSSNEYITQSGDTAYYSFKATKLMFRLSLDFKPFFPVLTELLGPQDLTIYSEATVVGIEGYNARPDALHPEYYNDLRRRIPIMTGLNLPTFKVLDVASFEMEYFPSYLPNDYRLVLYKMTPLPNVNASSYKPDDYKNRFWRWSFYARKEILKGFLVTGQIAFDHLRTTFMDGSTDTFECLAEPGNWYWVLKTVYSF